MERDSGSLSGLRHRLSDLAQMTRPPLPVSLSRQLFFAGLLLFCSACETKTTVKATADNPPKFTLAGSGVLFHFVVFEEDPRNEALPAEDRDPTLSKPIWRIQVTVSDKPVELSSVPVIEYGHTPEGFVQAIPGKGNMPPVLVEGKVYQAAAYVNGAAGGSVKFTVRNGQTVVLPD